MEFGGQKFKSSEHAYQYSKACFFDCSDYLKQQILKAPTALASKRVADGLPRTQAWDDFKPVLMFKILKSKFNQVPIFRDLLGDAFISGRKFTILSIASTGAMAEMAKVSTCLAGLFKTYLK